MSAPRNTFSMFPRVSSADLRRHGELRRVDVIEGLPWAIIRWDDDPRDQLVDPAVLFDATRHLKPDAAAPRSEAPTRTEGFSTARTRCAALLRTVGWLDSDEGFAERVEALFSVLEGRSDRRESATPVARSREEWTEETGPVLWWAFPVEEPPYAGTPLDDDFPEYMTHWTPIVVPEGT